MSRVFFSESGKWKEPKCNRRNQRPDLSDIIWKFWIGFSFSTLISLASQFHFLLKNILNPTHSIFNRVHTFQSFQLLWWKKSSHTGAKLCSGSYRHCIDTISRFVHSWSIWAFQRRLVEPSKPPSMCGCMMKKAIHFKWVPISLVHSAAIKVSFFNKTQTIFWFYQIFKLFDSL